VKQVFHRGPTSMSCPRTGVALNVSQTKSSSRKSSESIFYNTKQFSIFARLLGLAPRVAGGLMSKLVHYLSPEGRTLHLVIGRSNRPSLNMAVTALT